MSNQVLSNDYSQFYCILILPGGGGDLSIRFAKGVLSIFRKLHAQPKTSHEKIYTRTVASNTAAEQILNSRVI